METASLEILDIETLAPIDYPVTKDLVLRANPEFWWNLETNSGHLPRIPFALRRTGAVSEALLAFAEPRPAGEAGFGCSWPARTKLIRQLLGVCALVPFEAECLITGCGRSGTVYISSLLAELGADVAHETMGLEGIASWLLAVDASSAPWGPVRSDFRYRTILHQVRHPLAVIGSAQTFKPESWDYICQHIPCQPADPLVLRCAKYWHYWNLEAERIADWIYRIEDLPSVFLRFCDAAGVEADHSLLAAVSNSANSRKDMYQAIAWDDLKTLDPELTARIQLQSLKYGYEV